MDKRPLLGIEQFNYSTMPSEENDIITGGTSTRWNRAMRSVLSFLTATMCVVITCVVFYMFFSTEMSAHLISVVTMIACSWICGKLAGMVHLPPLLGMLLVGVVLRNIGKYDITNPYQKYIADLREVALTVLMVASGLGLNASMLKKLSMVVIQLAILPCITETIAAAVVTRYMMGFPWIWGILLGCILSPVSSAVILPALLDFKQKGLGEEKGIITLIMAACSFDDIFCISAFGVCTSIIFSNSDWEKDAMRGPLEILLGLGIGIIWGLIAGYMPHKSEQNLTAKRTYIITSGGILLTLGSKLIDYSGAGPLATMTSAFIASECWKKNDSFSENVEITANNVWDFLEPLLFASIGTEIDLSSIKPQLLISACILLGFTSFVRVLTCFFVLKDTTFNLREKIFVNIAWLPKATVQAAIGPLALDMARKQITNKNENISYATDVLAISVLAILITAPIGAILMTLRGEYLLRVKH